MLFSSYFDKRVGVNLLSSSCFSKLELEVPSLEKCQTTISKEVSASDIGLFTGAKVTVKLLPAPADTGIVFQRIDLPDAPLIPASVFYVKQATRCTLLVNGTASVQTVEHLLSALFAYQIDNVIVQLDGPEVPIFDGSSLVFVKMIQDAGKAILEEEANSIAVLEPVYFSNGESHIVALPSPQFRVSYTLSYPSSPLIGTQFLNYIVDSQTYLNEIAPARTFSNYEEVIPLIEKGYLKGGSLNNAVVIQGDKVLNPEGTRFSNEMVRHKILDLIGDMALVGCRIYAHFIAIKTGHAENASLAKTILEKFN